jgi:hypothetical protein
MKRSLLVFCLALLWSSSVGALPLYTAREGRTCDNCHTLPNRWKNPQEIKDRKCTLSCSACHIDPAGGGLRNTSGRFYGQTVLPMALSRYRNYKDTVRNALPRLDAANKTQRSPLTLAFGEPLGKDTPYAPQAKRYGDMKADPLVTLGLDARFAVWVTGAEAIIPFPMQLDVQAALHPMHHLTAYVNAGVLGKEKGTLETLQANPAFGVKDLMLIVNELPYQTYVKVGRFTPAFGTRLDDHTSFTRRDFEQDYGILQSRVFGAEFGRAPNYPYLHMSVFRPSAKDEFPTNDEIPNVEGKVEGIDFFGAPQSFGGAVSAGYRELGWQIGASVLSKRRNLSDGGDTNSLSVQWGVNPWFYSDQVPLTYLGEIAAGTFQRLGNGSGAFQAASTQELNYAPFNGLNVKLKYDYTDPDFEVANDQLNRVGLGFDLTFIPGLRLTAMGRAIFIPEAGAEADFFMFVRGWL